MTVVVMLARQRSGTNALQSVLEGHAEIDCAREVFHTDPDGYEHLDPAANWFRYVERRGAAVDVLSMQDAGRRLFADFLDEIRARTPKRYLVVDVKLNSARNLDAPWQSLTGPPRLFELVRARRLPVLVLRRRNHLRTWVSLLTAERTRDWVVGGAAPGAAVTLRLDVARLLRTLEQWRDEDELLERAFPPGAGRLTLEYEELFPRLDGPAVPEQLARIAAWLGVPDRFPAYAPAYGKLAVLPLAEVIENHDEVVAALRDTEFAYCLDDEPAYRQPG